jgi:photosystem II stability/assembly factor-like uncharacterized protein
MHPFLKKNILFLLFALVFTLKTKAQWQTVWEGKSVSLRGIEMYDENFVIASGSKGHALKSIDHGKTWQNLAPESFRESDFRGVQVLDKNTILLMSSGPAEEKKAFLLKSIDGGKNWISIFESKEKGVFYDAIKFKNKKTGYLLGDPVDKIAYFHKTKNGGKTWSKINSIPALLDKEASFAASNSSIVLKKRKIWFCTQNRIFYSKNKGKSWEAFSTPFGTENMRGIYGLALNQDEDLIAVGGDYNNKEEAIQFGMAKKNGKIWDIGATAIRTFTTECMAVLDANRLIAVGTGGTFISENKGQDWRIVSKISLHTITCKEGTCYAAGNGIIVRATLKDFENK